MLVYEILYLYTLRYVISRSYLIMAQDGFEICGRVYTLIY